jgi:hypothetical protein
MVKIIQSLLVTGKYLNIIIKYIIQIYIMVSFFFGPSPLKLKCFGVCFDFI